MAKTPKKLSVLEVQLLTAQRKNRYKRVIALCHEIEMIGLQAVCFQSQASKDFFETSLTFDSGSWRKTA